MPEKVIHQKKTVFNQPATSPFRLKSSFVLSARKTSASSSRRMQSHLFAKAKFVSSAFSTSDAVSPRSPGEGEDCQWPYVQLGRNAGFSLTAGDLEEGLLEKFGNALCFVTLSAKEFRIQRSDRSTNQLWMSCRLQARRGGA